MNSTKINRIIKITTLANDIIKQENNLKNKLLFACKFECTIETSTVIEEMKQSMDGDYSDVFSSVWNDTLFFVQFNYDSSASVIFHVRHEHKKLFLLNPVFPYDGNYQLYVRFTSNITKNVSI